MFVLHVTIKLKPGAQNAAEQVFAGSFSAAIKAQPGFRDVRFLRPNEDGDHVLAIAFENQTLQKQWVATDLHGKVWNEMEQHFDGYSLNTYTTV